MSIHTRNSTWSVQLMKKAMTIIKMKAVKNPAFWKVNGNPKTPAPTIVFVILNVALATDDWPFGNPTEGGLDSDEESASASNCNNCSKSSSNCFKFKSFWALFWRGSSSMFVDEDSIQKNQTKKIGATCWSDGGNVKSHSKALLSANEIIHVRYEKD